MINISSDIATALIQSVASIIQQLWVIFVILLSIIITFYIVRKIVFLFVIAKR